MNGRSGDYILFVSDIFLYRGGVGDYTDNFANQLFRHGKLNSVITLFVEKANRAYTIKKFKISVNRKQFYFDKWVFTRKLITLCYYMRLYYLSFIGIKKLVSNKKHTTIIFAEYYTRHFDILIFCTRLLKIRYGIVFHGLDLIKAKGNAKGNLFLHFNNNFSKANFVVFNSNATKKLCQTFFPSLHNYNIVLHPGIDVPLIEAEVKSSYKENRFRSNNSTIIFSTVSRLAKRKGIDIAIHIVSYLSKTYKNIKYYIGGVGKEEENLQRLVKELKAEEYIFFLGDISNKNKYQLLQESDIFILPNHSAGNSDFEGFGISFIEASLFGNVVIGGNHGGAVEAVLDKETGFLFDFDKKESIDKATTIITNCIEDRKLMDKIKMNGTNFVKANYDWNMLAQRFLQWDN